MTASNRTIKDYLLITLKGMAMGAADVVPGVSGGTVAFITGIYNELLHSLKQIGPQALVILYKEGLVSAWKYINGTFLVALFAGILVSLKTLATAIIFGMENYPLLIWAFFSGLIAASVVLLLKQQERWQFSQFLSFVIGVAFVVGVTFIKPAQLPGELWILFLGGFIAICAMILPGISGSFILLLIGLYPVFLQAIETIDVVALTTIAAGCASGLMVFSRFLSWLLDNYARSTLALLTGFLVGSLKVTWPWKVTVESTIDRHGEVIPLIQSNVMPWQFEQTLEIEPMVVLTLISACIGVFLVLSVDLLASKMSKGLDKE
ncbi:DUF368 domain-containing protein [Teredinibacter sp. KSP-S5-2]|uniref:DUF368 domain-containing protein n=1 Tax=Teredinibacter sp. KSP-S5-2 TaxID=3034506 RepID=UPI00293504E3|nr:DUF368 domain-containing protein [Teredinibacter sp. KSP-S5-2]WNO10353.1 DUF368 domain-containing protein [Teredinibacter sp. KSP-S5-2]